MTEPNEATVEAAKRILNDNPDAAREYRDEKDGGAENFLVGMIMQKTGGEADPSGAVAALREVESGSVIDWPVTFTVHRRPVDRDTLLERAADEIPRWQHDKLPEDTEDPTAVASEYRVALDRDGSVEIEHVGTEDTDRL